MPAQTILISLDTDTGHVRFLVSDATRRLFTDATIRRASHVEPCNKALRLLFHGLRRLCGDYGITASFTRKWRVSWRVNLAPINGPVLSQKFTDRQAAINAEISYLNTNFI